MKKRIPFTFIIVSTFIICTAVMIACSKMGVNEETTSAQNSNALAAEAITGSIGDPNRTPDLYIPQLEKNKWKYSESGLGLWQEGTYAVLTDSTGQIYTYYNCPIANDWLNGVIDYSGQSDFVVCMSCDGIPIEGSHGAYNYPGMLSITTFENGLPIFETIKQRFFVSPSEVMVGYDWTKQREYNQTDTMYINCGTLDSYRNKAKTKIGRQVVVIEINPDLLIHERNYNNNASVLPLQVSFIGTGGASLDTTIIGENKTHPATNLTGHHEGKNIKKVYLDWDCPYHEPIYVNHWFKIYRDGVQIADNVTDSNYTDDVSGSFRGADYSVVINVPGLGASTQTTIHVNK